MTYNFRIEDIFIPLKQNPAMQKAECEDNANYY